MTVQTTPTVDALTADGAIMRIRPAGPADRDRLTRLYRSASPDSLVMRFFAAPGERVLDAEVERVCRRATPAHRAFVGELGGRIVGVASYERDAEPSRAEFAVFVAEGYRHRGIGTLLLEHLTAAARAAGVTEVTGDVLPGNAAMLRVARDLSPRARSRLADGVVGLDLPTGAAAAELDAADARNRVAARASLRPLLSPRSVAVVGAGRTPRGVGHETLCALARYGFAGPLYAVNPHATVIAGVPAYPLLSAIPEPVDLAVIAVPAADVPAAVRDAAAAGVRAAVILTAGDGDPGEGRPGEAGTGEAGTGEGGVAAPQELVRVAREHGMRLVGPNSVGVLNTDPGVRLAAAFAPGPPSAGGLAVASQSGAVGIALLAGARRAGCGVSTFVSLGDKADVSGNDLIAYWHDDPSTRAVALYLESFGNPRRFARLVRGLARRKPVLAVKSGRPVVGAGGALPEAALETLFAQAGVIRVDTLGDLLDAARLVTDQPLPRGTRLGIVGNAGGVNALAADAAVAAGLTVAPLSAAVRERLAAPVPGPARRENPVDLGAGAGPAHLLAATRALVAGGELDALLVVLAATLTNDVPAMLAAVAPVLDAHPELPAAAVVLGVPEPPVTLAERRVPVFDLPERAARGLGHAARYAAWLREPAGTVPRLSAVDPTAARAAVTEGLAHGGGWQRHSRLARILGAYGISLLVTRAAATESHAVIVADEVGYPVALKVGNPALAQKSDIGVHLNLRTPAEVRAAYRAVARATGAAHPPVLVQPMAHGQLELVAGVVHDPLFGSLVTMGLGGVPTDLLGDRAVRLTPLTTLDASRMWRSLRGAPLLTGYRGAPPVDTAAVEDLLLRLGRLAADLPEVAELRLSPILAGPNAVVAVDAKLRLAPVDAEPDPTVRALNPPSAKELP
ncbi:bifunctional acetate--CoA ligase family protein/GNAT family N-acetyltransferase [Rhizomonospora bruguierae]|uniref:bifunctional acetate--CoA ligase family protein/GNAT family N-acetyltransferase n=1 Tax=Rhizomonospora bruguierae TaxID=1581705 RepID=UPI0020BDE908|nr:GNAT family N-acetyltransferase [Micromonospora sp. NBRC 107566]